MGYANADKLENYVIERLKKVSTQKPVFEAIVDQANLDLESETMPYKKELDKVKQRISEVNQEIDNFLNAIPSQAQGQSFLSWGKGLRTFKTSLRS